MNGVFEIKNHQCNFRRDVRLQRRNVSTALYGTETVASLAAQIWNLVPENSKCSKSFNEFKKKKSKMDYKLMSLSSMQSVCTKTRIYTGLTKLTYTGILHL